MPRTAILCDQVFSEANASLHKLGVESNGSLKALLDEVDQLRRENKRLSVREKRYGIDSLLRHRSPDSMNATTMNALILALQSELIAYREVLDENNLLSAVADKDARRRGKFASGMSLTQDGLTELESTLGEEVSFSGSDGGLPDTSTTAGAAAAAAAAAVASAAAEAAVDNMDEDTFEAQRRAMQSEVN